MVQVMSQRLSKCTSNQCIRRLPVWFYISNKCYIAIVLIVLFGSDLKCYASMAAWEFCSTLHQRDRANHASVRKESGMLYDFAWSFSSFGKLRVKIFSLDLALTRAFSPLCSVGIHCNPRTKLFLIGWELKDVFGNCATDKVDLRFKVDFECQPVFVMEKLSPEKGF